MRAGFFATNITPPMGTMQAGNYSPAYIKGVAGDMKVRAAVFENEGRNVAFAVVDCCSLARVEINRALEYYSRMNAPKIDSFIISATHTHSGPSVSSFVQADLIDCMKPEVKALLKDSPMPDRWFVDYVCRQIATAIAVAAQRLEPAMISTGKGEEGEFIFNRRFYCKDGRAYSHPGKMNPDIVKPAGPVDPMVGVIGAWRQDGSLIGALVNYSCHGTAYSGHDAHGDWICYVDETVKKLFGSEAGVVVLNGPCGDVTQVDNRSFSRDFGIDIARRIGFRVGAEAAKVLISAPKQDNATLAFADEMLPVSHRVPRPESIEEAWKIVRETEANPTCTEAVFARERIFASELLRLQPERSVPLTAIQIGDALVLSVAAEYFTEMSLRIKAESPFEKTLVVELANDCVGYVPTKEAFDEKTGGGYETCLTGYSNLCIDAGDLIADKLIAMSKNFTPDELEPVTGKVGTYWTYGTRGPDRD